MKKLLILAGLLLFASGVSLAVESVWISSHSSTADGTQVLCGGTPTKRGYLYKVIVSSVGTGGGSRFTVYNSSFATTDPRADVDTRTLGDYEYRAGLPGGMSYTKTGTATTSILYSCY